MSVIIAMVALFLSLNCVKPLEYGNFSTIFDDATNVSSYYRNCSLFDNVRVFHSLIWEYDWSTRLEGLEPDKVFTIVLSSAHFDPWQRMGAAALMAMHDFCQFPNLLEDYTFE